VPPSSRALTDDTKRDFLALKTALYELFAKMIDFIAVTIDLWTSSANEPCAGLTGQFFDRNGLLQERVLSCGFISYPHTTEVIADYVNDVLRVVEYKIQTKISAVMADGASNMKGPDQVSVGQAWCARR
jgi:hypothetical protein